MITIADWKDEEEKKVVKNSHKRKRSESKRAPKNNNNNNKHPIGDHNTDKSRICGLDVVKWRPLKFPNSHPRNGDGAIDGLVRSGHASYEDEEGRLVLVGGGSG